jgi:glycosyltransferase involved in cell wall biosynthesis
MQLVAAIVLVLWVLAFARTVLNLATVPRLSADAHPLQQPLVSIVIPARNEARVLEQTIRAFLAQDYTALEVIVVNDRSTDETGAIARSIDDPRLIVIDGEEPPAGWLGKPWALHQGSGVARGDLLLFVDADLIYAPATVRAAVAQLELSGVAMIALLPRFDMHGFAENALMPMLAFTVLSVMPVWLSNRSMIVALALGSGSGNLIRRDAFDMALRFEPLRGAVVDDIALARLVRRKGLPTRVVRADDLISLRMYRGAREIIEGFSKNMFIAMGGSFVLGVLMLILMFLFHLLPYVLAVTGDITSVATVILISATRLVLFRSLRYRLDNALFLHPIMVLGWAYLFLRSMWITGVRGEVRWRGRTYDAARTRFGAER